jgi:hypothetical protein
MTPGDHRNQSAKAVQTTASGIQARTVKNRVGVAMVYSMKPPRERVKGMAEPTVNGIFKKCPNESARQQQGDIFNHDVSLSHRWLKVLVCFP